MSKTMVINEVCYGFEIDTIIHNGAFTHFVIIRDNKFNKEHKERNWSVLAFGSMYDIFDTYNDTGFDYKVDLKWRKGEAFATYEDYIRWFNSKVSNDDVEKIESDLLTW